MFEVGRCRQGREPASRSGGVIMEIDRAADLEGPDVARAIYVAEIRPFAVQQHGTDILRVEPVTRRRTTVLVANDRCRRNDMTAGVAGRRGPGDGDP